MLGTWKGFYQYTDERIQKAMGYPRTNFVIEINQFENDTFSGNVNDDIASGGMEGIGVIQGEIHKSLIYFEKKMPKRDMIDLKNGKRQTFEEPHPIIFYVGELTGENKYKGTWKFEKKWGFLFGFIPFKYSPGKGLWEMELIK